MKKKISDKLRKNKMCKTVFALSLALALLLSGLQPLTARADDIIPSFSDLVANTDAWVHIYVRRNSTSSTTYNGVNKHYVFIWNELGEYERDIYISWLQSSNPSYGTVRGRYNDSVGASMTHSVVADYVYQLSSVDGTGVWNDVTATFKYGFGSKGDGGKWLTNVSYELVNVKFDIDVYAYNEANDTTTIIHEAVQTLGNSNEATWNDFLSQTRDFIGYHYLTENGSTLWKEMRFNHVVYPYWEQDTDGTRKLMIYAPYEQTIYMTKDVGRYVEDGIYDYYISTIERTDEHCIQPYAWYTDYQPDTSAPDKVFEVIALPYIKDGWGADANAERTLIEVYDSKADAISAYNADEGIIDSPEVTPTIPPQPSPEPLPPTDDSESMGFVDFIKQFENLFNASGNLWKIMFYCFAFLPQQILWCLWSAVQIFLAVMVIKWIRE